MLCLRQRVLILWPNFSSCRLNGFGHCLSNMPFPGKVGWVCFCSACTKQAIVLVHSERGPGKTICLPSCGRYFRIGEAGFPVFSQGAEIKKPRPVSESTEPGRSRSPLFSCANPCCKAKLESVFTGRDTAWLCSTGFLKIWCPGVGFYQACLGRLVLLLLWPPPVPVPCCANLCPDVSSLCPLLLQESIRHPGAPWECWLSWHCVSPVSVLEEWVGEKQRSK